MNKNIILKLTLFLLLSVFIGCTTYPDSLESVADRIFTAIKKNDFSRIWKIYSNNPGAYKFILLRQYRENKITKAVYQREMGRIVYLEVQAKKRLKEDFGRITFYIQSMRVPLVSPVIEKKDMNSGYFVYKIGSEDRNLRINVHFLFIGGKYFIVSIYSAA